MLKMLFSVVMPLGRRIKAQEFKGKDPNYTKRYDVRPMLEHRVFLPSSYQPGVKLPLYLDIHGGGFAVGDPQMDDDFCRLFSDNNGFCVVSLNYRKAPGYPFPVAVHDLAAVTKAVLADPDLPIDRTKVAAGGFSAGGNLVLAISQLDDLRDQIKGLIPVYPATDLSLTFRGEMRKTKDGKPDVLEGMSSLFDWAYIPVGQDRTEPLMSPIYATKEMLPSKIFFIGVEYDCLCQEGNIMAKKLAGVENDPSFTGGEAWEKNGIKWWMVPDLQHGFNLIPAKGEEEIRRKAVTKEMYSKMAEWLKSSVF